MASELVSTRDATSELDFRPLTRADFSLLAEWLARPHVATWWGATSPAELEAELGPAIDGVAPQWCYLACVGGEPIGFIQSYAPSLCHGDGWWLDESDPGVRGIDLFLADENTLGRGLGTAMVRSFLAALFRDPSVTRMQVDPDPANARAIRCYEKAGFRASRLVTTPDGPALVMYAERSTYKDVAERDFVRQEAR